MGFEGFKQYFEADKSGAAAADLKNIYSGFQNVFPELPSAKTKQDMANALRHYESQHPGRCALIPSEDQFYGASKGTSRLAPHVQWVFISADKDVSEESDETKNSALGQLLARTIRSKVNFAEKVSKLRDDIRRDYQAILDGEQPLLDELSVSLGIRLKNWAHPNATAQILWKQDPDKSVKVEEPWAYIKLGERGFEGDLTRFGHGLQRSYLLTLLQVLSEVDDANAPTLIMGIEEPEIYQHPPQAKYLAEVMHDLSEAGSQVIVCSHSPLFIPCDHFESIRIVREKGTPAASYVSQLTYKDLSQCLKDAGQKHLKEAGMLAKLYPALNPVINEMFFCKTLILVEGIEDVSYLTAYLMLNGKIKDFRKHGCHIVPVGGKSEIVKPLSMAKLLDIPVYVVCDADTNKERESEITKHKIDNKAILKLLGHDAVNEWPTETIRLSNLTMWQSNITDFIENEIGTEWNKYVDKSAAYYGNPGGLQKNPLAVSHALEAAWNDGLKSSSLVKLVEDIVAFAS